MRKVKKRISREELPGRGARPVPSMLLARVPAAQRKAVPGVLVDRNVVSIGISKDEGAPERTIIGLRNDGSPSRFHFGMQLIDMIAVDPERHTPSRLRCFIQVHFCFAESKRDRAGIEEDKIGSVEAWIDSEAQQLRVERTRGGEVAHLQADKIGSEKLCHGSSFLSKLRNCPISGPCFLSYQQSTPCE